MVAVVDHLRFLTAVPDHILATDGELAIGIFRLVLLHVFPSVLLLEEGGHLVAVVADHVVLHIGGLAVLIVLDRSVVVGTVHQRRFAVLVAVEVGEQRHRIVRVVFVQRRVGVGADHQDEEGGVADQDEGEAEGQHVQQPFAVLFGIDHPPDNQSGDQYKEDNGAGGERGVEPIDENALEGAGQLHDPWHNAPQDQCNHDKREQQCIDNPLGGGFVFAEIDHQHHGGQRQQVQQVHADGEPHQVGDQDQPAVGAVFVRHLFPFEDGPEDQGGEEGGHGIDLALNRREPEGVRKGVGGGTDQCAAKDGDQLRHAQLFARLLCKAFGEERDAPEKEHDGQAAAKGRHAVDADGDVGGILREHGEEAAEQLEGGGTGRVSDLQFAGGGDIFAAIPEADGGFGGHEVDHGGQQADRPSQCGVDDSEFFIHVFLLCVFRF